MCLCDGQKVPFFGEFRALAWCLDNLYSPKRLGFIEEGEKKVPVKFGSRSPHGYGKGPINHFLRQIFSRKIGQNRDFQV
jgi:hypothetical protein